MRVLELSMEELQQAALRLAGEVGRDYRPDCVVYVARTGFAVGRPMAAAFEVPLVEVRALRRGGRLKDLLVPVLRRLPRSARCLLRRLELISRRCNPRTGPQWVSFANEALPAGCRNLLVVDDSVDTGATLAAVCRLMHRYMGESCLRTAALNVWAGSEARARTDYSLYRNTLLLTPMSRDSAQYTAFSAAHGVKA